MTSDLQKPDLPRENLFIDQKNQVMSRRWQVFFRDLFIRVGEDTELTNSEIADLIEALSNLDASLLVATDSAGEVISVTDLTAWIAGTTDKITVTSDGDGTLTISISDNYLPNNVAGTSNRVTVADDGDGSITLSGPQDIHTGASPEFVTITASGVTAIRIAGFSAGKVLSSISNLAAWVLGTTNQIISTDNGNGSCTLSTPQNIHTNADVVFDSATLNDLTALELVTADAAKKLVSIADGTEDELLTTNGAGTYAFKTLTLPDQLIQFSMYDAEPARGSETNWCGGLVALATNQPLDSVPTDLVVTKGIGKLVIVINAGADIDGGITITGTSVDRNTGATTGADTDTITVDALTTDDTTTDANGNTVHDFTGAYISSKWFEGSVTLSTVDLTLTDVDVYHCSFEQVNDTPGLTLDTFDANIFTTNVNAEFDAYLHTLHVTGNKCNIDNESSLHVGAVGMTALANKYERLRRGNINEALDGTTDGFWVDIHYSNSPTYVEDVTVRVWFSIAQSITLT